MSVRAESERGGRAWDSPTLPAAMTQLPQWTVGLSLPRSSSSLGCSAPAGSAEKAKPESRSGPHRPPQMSAVFLAWRISESSGRVESESARQEMKVKLLQAYFRDTRCQGKPRVSGDRGEEARQLGCCTGRGEPGSGASGMVPKARQVKCPVCCSW